MSVNKFELQLVEGRKNPVTGLLDSVEAGDLSTLTINRIKSLCLTSDHYRATFTVYFDNGDEYKGNIILHPELNPYPLEWIQHAIEGFIESYEYKADLCKEHLEFLKNHFKTSYNQIMASHRLLAF